MRSGKSYCGALYNTVNCSVEQNAMLAGWSFCCVIIHKKICVNIAIMVRGCAFLSSAGLHTEVAVEWPYVSFV